jgi:uncharacterized protein YkwD
MRYWIIAVCFLFAIVGTSTAQEVQHKDLALLFKSGNFPKCLKKAEAKISASPKDALPHIYKAMSLFQGRENKKILKLYSDPFATSVEILKQAKPLLKKNDVIPNSFRITLKSIQGKMFSQARRNYKKKKESEGDNAIEQLFDLFDNSTNIFQNFYFDNVCEYYIENAGKGNNKAATLQKAYNRAHQTLQSLLKNPNDRFQRYHLKEAQKVIFESFVQLDNHDQADQWASLLLNNFDNSSERLRNFHLYALYQFYKSKNKWESKATALLSTSAYSNLKDDIKKCTDEQYYFEEWNKPEYMLCNTANNASYLTKEERNLIYIANLARMNPELFEATFLSKYKELNSDEVGGYTASLSKDLLKAKDLDLFYPDSLLYEAAKYHAIDMGKIGRTGHRSSNGWNADERIRKYIAGADVTGECCDYGIDLSTEMILHLLVDKGVSSLGHRKALLDKEEGYKLLGVSIQPHKKYGISSVFDFTD